MPNSHRDPHTIGRLEQHLADRPDVDAVTTNRRTGSVLIITNDESVEDRDLGIIDDLDEIGNVLSFGMAGSEVDNIATQLGSVISRLNGRLYDATGENFHLGTLIPGSMAVLGVWQTVRTGLGLELIPGPLILWLAWDLHRAFGSTGEPTGAV